MDVTKAYQGIERPAPEGYTASIRFDNCQWHTQELNAGFYLNTFQTRWQSRGQGPAKDLRLGHVDLQPKVSQCSNEAGKKATQLSHIAKTNDAVINEPQGLKPRMSTRKGGSSPEASQCSRSLPHMLARTRLKRVGKRHPPLHAPSSHRVRPCTPQRKN